MSHQTLIKPSTLSLKKIKTKKQFRKWYRDFLFDLCMRGSIQLHCRYWKPHKIWAGCFVMGEKLGRNCEAKTPHQLVAKIREDYFKQSWKTIGNSDCITKLWNEWRSYVPDNRS